MKGERLLAKTELVPGIHLVDKDFHGADGITRYSLEFWEKIKPRLKNIVKAKMIYDENEWYKFFLITEDDVVIEFRGFASGFGGEGPRGCAAVLKEAGFDPDVVFEKENFELVKEA